MEEDELTYLEMTILWSIYKIDDVTTKQLSSITKVSEEDIKNTIKELMYKGYVDMDKNYRYILTKKGFNYLGKIPKDIKDLNLKTKAHTSPTSLPQTTSTPTNYTNTQSYPPPTIEVKMPEKKGSIGLGAFATFIVSVLFSFIPIIGWLASFFGGFLGGLIAKGAGRGALAGFLGIFSAVIIGAILVGILFHLVGGSFIGGVEVGGVMFFILGFVDIILATLGGLIGGAIRR